MEVLGWNTSERYKKTVRKNQFYGPKCSLKILKNDLGNTNTFLYFYKEIFDSFLGNITIFYVFKIYILLRKIVNYQTHVFLL